jgi:alkylation response protein AidB-like acyl-CoA dehydrogenase
MAALNEEQSMIKDQAQAWVTEQAPVLKFREMRNSGVTSGFTPQTWQDMVEMGWTGIIIPEQYGGSDLGYLTFGVVLEETGKQLTASPLLASALVGASALLLGGNEAQKQTWLPKIVDGSAIFSFAVDEGPRHAPLQIALQAKVSGEGFVLNGTKTFVLEGVSATHLVVAARTQGQVGEADGITLFLVATDTPGVTCSRLQTADSRGYANIDFANVELGNDMLIGQLHGAAGLLDQILDRARAGLAAEMLGTAAQSFAMTLDYLKTRVQFGQVIGAFQALGHRAAELFAEMELTRSCVEAALQAIDSESEKVDQLCSLSKCKAGAFVFHASNELIQIHGGIGMTDDFDAGFYLKRARAQDTTYGSQAFHRDRYARLLDF